MHFKSTLVYKMLRSIMPVDGEGISINDID